ncbi:hypothetical protein D3C79_854060 [compost metagenome]
MLPGHTIQRIDLLLRRLDREEPGWHQWHAQAVGDLRLGGADFAPDVVVGDLDVLQHPGSRGYQLLRAHLAHHDVLNEKRGAGWRGQGLYRQAVAPDPEAAGQGQHNVARLQLASLCFGKLHDDYAGCPVCTCVVFCQ